MHQSIFDYNLSRPYPYRWFTWLVFIGGAVATVIFSLINFEVAGFELDIVHTTNPTEIESPSKTAWYQRRPWSLASKVGCQSKRPKCLTVLTAPPSDDFYLLRSDDQCRLKSVTIRCTCYSVLTKEAYYTNNHAFPYTIVSIWKDQSTKLESLAYKNTPLRDCILPELRATDEAIAEYSDSSDTVHMYVEPKIYCAIDFGEQRAVLGLSTQFGYTYDGFEPFKNSMLSVFEIQGQYNETSPSLFWGQQLMLGYFSRWESLRLRHSFMNVTSDTIKGEMFWDTTEEGGLNDPLQTVFSFAGPSNSPYNAYWVNQNSSCTESVDCPILSRADWAFSTFEDEADHIKFYTGGLSDVIALNATDPRAFVGLLLDQIGKCLYWTILTDLGQGVSNMLADPERLVSYFTESVKYLYPNGSSAIPIDGSPPKSVLEGLASLKQFKSMADFYSGLGTGIPNVHPAVFAQEYTCQVPKMKSPGGLIISIIVADLVFLQTLWKILNWLTTLILTRQDPRANYCAGCEERGLLTRDDNEDDVEMGGQEVNHVSMSCEAEMAQVDHHNHEASSLMASINQSASDNEDQEVGDAESDLAATEHSPTVLVRSTSTDT